MKLLHPFSVFILVTAVTTLVYALPNLRQALGADNSTAFGRMTLLLNLLFPVATGLVAAVGAHLGLSDLRKKHGAVTPAAVERSFSPDERFRAIARDLPTPALTLDRKGKVTFLNSAAADLFDAGSNKVNDTVDSFLDRWDLRDLVDKVFHGSTLAAERTGGRPDNPEDEQTWKVTGVPVQRKEDIVEALLLIEDNTQFRILEEELIRSEDRYRNIFNHAPCGIFFVDSQGRYLDANPAALEMLGYTLEELTALSTRELSADSDKRLRRLRETPGWVEEATRYLRKDGKVVEAQLLASSYQSGRETYFIGIARDVTAKNELERSLAAARARLKAVLSLESKPLLLLDSRERIASINSAAADLLDCSSEKLVGLPLGQLIVGDLPPIQETSTAVSTPCVFNLPDGPPMNLSVMRLPLGHTASAGSLLLFSGGPLPVRTGTV